MEKQKSVGGLWSKTSSKGKSYLSGNVEIDGKKVLIVAFHNAEKRNPKEPDYRILESRPLEKSEDNPLPTQRDETITPEDIPF